MTQMEVDNPFHAGERAAQQRAGVGDVSKWAGGFIRDHLPEQHREFHSALPFLVISGSDRSGRTWATLIDGPKGFISSPDARSLAVHTELDPRDPLADALNIGANIGVLGIELASRRRNRLSGFMRKTSGGFTIDVSQTFGNCPQYIHERHWSRVNHTRHQPVRYGSELTTQQIKLIAGADTLFLGSGHMQGDDTPSSGYDASHRGGAPGFVRVENPKRLRIPDYAGNNFFNTIGNLMADPRIGVTFVDFETGGLLHISGRAKIDWSPKNGHDPDALRMIDVTVDAVVERPGALNLRWTRDRTRQLKLRVARRVDEAEDITSFYLRSATGTELPPFEAGQHLPVEVDIPGRTSPLRRSYSLSGAPQDTSQYRLTIKRDPKGLVSRHFHKAMQVGDHFNASRPSGTFLIPEGDAPLVLVSAGVGLTPMVSFLHALVSQNARRQVWFIHGARDGPNHAFRSEVSGLMARLPNAKQVVFYSKPCRQDVQGEDFHTKGRITPANLVNLGAGAGAQYMLCGPASFLSDIQTGLEAADVPSRNIHIELFNA
ncbi:MAG: pyridoxamine 5'-phosphate oxidase family protein [Ruegeria sp.]